MSTTKFLNKDNEINSLVLDPSNNTAVVKNNDGDILVNYTNGTWAPTNNAPVDILKDRKVLIVAHGNSLRALIMYLDKISENAILKYNIPTGVPLVYELNKSLQPTHSYYLGDQSEIQKKVNAVASQGKSK